MGLLLCFKVWARIFLLLSPFSPFTQWRLGHTFSELNLPHCSSSLCLSISLGLLEQSWAWTEVAKLLATDLFSLRFHGLLEGHHWKMSQGKGEQKLEVLWAEAAGLRGDKRYSHIFSFLLSLTGHLKSKLDNPLFPTS